MVLVMCDGSLINTIYTFGLFKVSIRTAEKEQSVIVLLIKRLVCNYLAIFSSPTLITFAIFFYFPKLLIKFYIIMRIYE